MQTGTDRMRPRYKGFMAPALQIKSKAVIDYSCGKSSTFYLHMDQFTNYLGITAGIVTGVSLLPQLFKIIKNKKAEDISYFMLAVLITGLCGWVWYGIRKKDMPIIFTNAFSILINILTIIFSARYKNKNGNKQEQPS
jgi:MtN3 and saliva related transmembrane protein